MNHQKEIFDALRQSTHSAYPAIETQGTIEKLSAKLGKY
jgi:hypothetical protein